MTDMRTHPEALSGSKQGWACGPKATDQRLETIVPMMSPAVAIPYERPRLLAPGRDVVVDGGDELAN